MVEVVIRAQRQQKYFWLLCAGGTSYKIQDYWELQFHFPVTQFPLHSYSYGMEENERKISQTSFLSTNLCLSCRSLMEDQIVKGHSCHFFTQMRCPLSCLGIGHLTLYVDIRSFLTALHPALFCFTAVSDTRVTYLELHVFTCHAPFPWGQKSQGSCLILINLALFLRQKFGSCCSQRTFSLPSFF